MPSHSALQVPNAANDGTPSFLADKSAKVFLAGHRGMLGTAIHRRLAALGFTNIVVRTRAELDLTCEAAVVLRRGAAPVRDPRRGQGGQPPRQLRRAGRLHDREPPHHRERAHRRTPLRHRRQAALPRHLRHLPRPARRRPPADTGVRAPHRPTGAGKRVVHWYWYAIPKIVGIKMCQAYRAELDGGMDAIVATPNNLYGPRDPFPSESSHVIPALIRRFHDAKAASGAAEVMVWGSGRKLREFTHADDAADAVVLLMETYSGAEHVNVGSGREVTVRELAETVREMVGYEGRVVWNTSRPDGVMRRLLDSSKMASLGWEPKVECISFEVRDGLKKLYEWYLSLTRGSAADFEA